jgi:ABC-type multidrug transport system fused ATPase/permease subunit
MYYAAHAISGHAPFHFSTMTSLQRGLSWLKWRIQDTFTFGGKSQNSLQAVFSKIKQFYTVMDDIGEPIDDGLSYPPASDTERGMHIELRYAQVCRLRVDTNVKLSDVTFSYPNSQSSQPAVRSISCVLRSGQLVVIVGSNGSAKTTLTKLLTRLYEPSSGTILIDGRPSSEYRVRDLRQATALLAQEHFLFPLPLKENIATGLPDASVSQFAIQDAAKKGGAHEFISNYDAGYDAILNPVATKWHRDLPSDHALIKLHNVIEKQVGVSGESAGLRRHAG